MSNIIREAIENLQAKLMERIDFVSCEMDGLNNQMLGRQTLFTQISRELLEVNEWLAKNPKEEVAK